MQRDESYLLDILESARLVLQYVSDNTLDEFLDDVKSQDAVVRRFILIGEAARRISPETRDRYPQVPWRDMIDMRNLVIHEYEDVDFLIVWDTAHQDLPQLIRSLEDIAEDPKKPSDRILTRPK